MFFISCFLVSPQWKITKKRTNKYQLFGKCIPVYKREFKHRLIKFGFQIILHIGFS